MFCVKSFNPLVISKVLHSKSCYQTCFGQVILNMCSLSLNAFKVIAISPYMVIGTIEIQ